MSATNEHCLNKLKYAKLTISHLVESMTYSENVLFLILGTTQLTFTCSKSTIETLEKGVKYV